MAVVSDGTVSCSIDKPKIQGIYKIRNCINGKVYIGQSIDIEFRWRNHKNCITSNIKHPLYNSMRKYGLENFEFNIIEEVIDINTINAREQYWMDYYKSYNPEFGYNICTFARSTKGRKASDETKRKIGLASKGHVMSNENKLKLLKINKGRKVSEETKIKLSKANKGQIAWNKGKKSSEETKRKLSEIVKLQWKVPGMKDKMLAWRKVL